MSNALDLADDPSAEVWSRQGLGKPCRKTYRELARATAVGGHVSAAAIAEAVERHLRTVTRHLTGLADVNLARSLEPGWWTAEYRDPVELAFDLGVVGVNAARAARHAAERRDDALRRAKYRLAKRGAVTVDQPAYDPIALLAVDADTELASTAR